MSFEDLQSGSGRSHVIAIHHHHQQQQEVEDPSRGIPVAIFRLNTAFAAFQRLVASLGTPKDTPDLRLKLHNSRLKIQRLLRETSDKLKQATEADRTTQVSATKKIADFKLTRDFQYVLKEFEKAQRLAAEREAAYAPSTFHQVLPSSCHLIEMDTDLLRRNEQISDLEETRRPDIVLVENEIVFSEALIKEREQGMIEIQQQIREVNEIFKDLAVLVTGQGYMIDDMCSNVERSRAATAQGTSELTKASKIQRANSSMKCLTLLIFGIILLIVVVVVVA